MLFVFAYLANSMGWPIHEWPLRLIYLTEAAFIIVAFVCVLLAARLRRTGTWPWHYAVAVAGGVSVGCGLIMPFEFAPIFFGVRGEWMMLTILLELVYPIAIGLSALWFSKFMEGDRPRTDFLVASGCYDRGIAFLDSKDYDGAIHDLKEAIQHWPRYVAAYYDRGSAYLGQKDYDHAIADYDQVIVLDPKHASAYRDRGNAYRAKGELARANAEFDKANALMRGDERRSHPQREVNWSGVMRVFAEWRNSRGIAD
jgi:tetratricopeptide (TPR) repeat protein